MGFLDTAANRSLSEFPKCSVPGRSLGCSESSHRGLCLPRYETTKAGDAVKALKASLKPQATACRDGRWQTIDAALLVPGDLVLLGSGSHVPADCRVSLPRT